MLYPISRKDQLTLLFVTTILLTAGPSSGSPVNRFPQPAFTGNLHLSDCFSPDTNVSAPVKKKTPGASRYIHTERNGDLVIAVPDAGHANYKIRFLRWE